ncbi:MAG: hypothetical protein ACYC47_00420 [Desulfobacteria bacterium]|nr:hypothetical protein [Deltaproteobacteria bacterium]
MKRTRLTILSACLLMFVATVAAAGPPAGWDPYTPPSVTGTMWTLGSVTLNGSPLPVDNASLIAVFVDNVTSPVGVFKMNSADTSDGVYGLMTVYGHGSFDPPPPKIAAVTGDLLHFKIYFAAIDNVLDVFTVQNYGDYTSPLGSPIDNVTYSEFAADNVTLNFRYDFPPVFTTVPTSGSINEGDVSPFTVHAVDPNGDTIAYFATSLPTFCTLGPGTGAGLCTPSFDNAGVFDNICFTAVSTGFSGTPKSTAPVCVTLTVLNVNRPPTWTIGGDNAATMTTYPGQGAPFTRTYAASDLDNQALTWSLQNNPSYCSLAGTGNSRTLTCAPTLADQGTTASNVKVIVTDGIDNTVDTFDISVGNRPPTIGAIGTQTISYLKSTPTVLPVTLSDPDGNAVSFTVSVSPTPPSGGSWGSYDNAARTITVTGPVPITDNGAYTVTIHATDNASSPLTDNTSFTLNIALQIAWDALPTSKTMNEGGDNTFTFHATDPLAVGTETHLLSGKPAFCDAINATTGALRCRPGYTDNGVYTMTLRARAIDNVTYALPDNVSITLTVLNVNRPPTWTIGGDNAATMTTYPGQGAPFLRTYSASDLDNEALTWTLQGAPSYCSLTGSGNSRTLSCTPTLADQGTTASNVKVIVTDGIDNTVDTFDISAGNRKPVITAIATQNVSYAKTSPTVIPVVLSDPDGNGVSFTAAMSPSKSWFSYDNAARTVTVTGPVPITDNGAYAVAITATDNAGSPLTDNTSFTLNIALQIAWDTVPTSKTMNEGGDNTFTFHATDPLAPGQESHIFLGKPAFCVDNVTTGALRCRPGYFDNGVYTMTLRAHAIDNVTYAIPDNVSITLTVNNVNRSPVLTPTPAGALSGNVGATFSKSYVASDPDGDPLTWATFNVPPFCQVTPSTGNTRTFTCSPTVANEGTFDNVVVRVSDGTAQAEESFSVTVNNRAPSISAIADPEVVYTATSATTIPVTVIDPDGDGVTANATISPTPSGGWFSFSGNVITIGTGIPRADAGMYTVTVVATDNGTPARSAADVTFTLRVTHPRHFGVPVAQAASMSLGVSGLTLSGASASLFDEVAAFSVHRVPGSLPPKWESKLVGWGRVDNTAGVLPAMAVYGDDLSTASVREGMANGEEILLVLWHNDPASAGSSREYYAFDNGAGAPVSVTWDNTVASKSLDAVNFIPGNRYPLRNGAWNLFGHGIATGYHTGALPSNSQLPGIVWNAVANLGDAFPLQSIQGKVDRVISNDGSGNKVFLPGVGGTMTYFAPGYGYYIRMKPSAAELSWITVPGDPVSASASLTAGQGYSLLGVWDESHVYSQNGYDPTGELRSLRAFVDTGVGFDTTLSSIAQVWPSGTDYDRVIMYDATGARFFLQTLPPQFNTLRYVAPGYGFWINVTNPSGMMVYFPPARN